MTARRVPDHIAILSDFVRYADLAARLVARGRSAFDGDEFVQLASEAIMHRVGEVVARLDDAFLAAHPEVRWRPMKAMRHLVAHEYDAVDHAIVWNALEHDLPREAELIRGILDGLSARRGPRPGR